ncbi:MAG: HD domain-containing protein [Desulfobaccales bacterium]
MINPPSLAIPSLAECLELMEAHGMLPNIREHSFAVMQVAFYLGDALVAAGFDLVLPLVTTGALLHDLGKTACLGTTRNHAEWGAAVLEDLGFSQVAQVVREHVYLDGTVSDPRPLREAEVVNYADKRVLHDAVVTLEDRFADLQVRYGRTPEIQDRIRATEVRARALEQKLFGPLLLDPSNLLHLNHCRRESWENYDWPSLPGANPRSGKSR